MTSKTIGNWLTPSFIVNFASMTPGKGCQISWADVPVGYVDADTGKKRLPAGKVMCYITTVGATQGLAVPHDSTAATGATKFFILQTSADEDASKVNSFNGYGTWIGGNVYDNLLPDATGAGATKAIAGGLKTSLNTAGCNFYYDVREVTYN